MNRNPNEDYSKITTALRQLDDDIPVPYAATAQGMRDRLSAAPKKAKYGFSFRKMIPVMASLVLVVAGTVLMRPALTASNKMAMEAAPAAAAPMDDSFSMAANAEATAQEMITADAEPAEDIGSLSKSHGYDSASQTDGAAGTRPKNQAMFRTADNYEDIKLALAAAPASSAPTDAVLTDADSSFSLAAGSYQYTLTCTPDGQARLTIRSTQDGAILSSTDLSCLRGSLYLQDNLLILAGEGENGTVLQVFDISDLSCPILAKTMVQEGTFLGTWVTENAMLVASLYHVDDMTKPIPTVNGEQLSIEQILLDADNAAASYAVVTAIPISADADASTFAVLGGSRVEFYAGELTVSTADGDTLVLGQTAFPENSGK